MKNDCHDIISQYIVNSLYSYVFESSNDVTIFFESYGCGQNTTWFNTIVHPLVSIINIEYIQKLWENNHLSKLLELDIAELSNIINEYSNVYEESFVETYVNKLIENGEI